MAGIREAYRRRFAGGLLLLGIGLILIGAMLILTYHPTHEPRTALHTVATTPKLLQSLLYVTVLLILLFTISVVAFMRWSRRFRSYILRKPKPPTPVDDVWLMHRLPETGEEDEPSSDEKYET